MIRSLALAAVTLVVLGACPSPSPPPPGDSLRLWFEAQQGQTPRLADEEPGRY